MSLAGIAHAVEAAARAEWRSRGRVDVPLRRRLWLYRHGVLSERDAVWDLSAATVGDYLTDRQRSACARIDRPYQAALKNKVLFRLTVGPTHGDLLPAVYGLLRDGAVVGADTVGGCPLDDAAGGVRSLDDLLSLVERRPVVAKPVDGAKGDSVRVLDAVDGQLRVDGRPVDRGTLRSELANGRDLLLEDRVRQADYAAATYPHATNTVRLLTMLDRDGEPFVAGAMHRFGTAASGAIDNWDAGGASAGVDPETGTLGRAVRRSPDGPGAEWTDDHPDTGARVAGRSVPGWDRVTDAVLDLAGEYGALWPYVGWDVVVTDDDGSVAVLEGNANPGVEALQAHRPLLRDDRARAFFERHGVLDG